MADSYDIAIVGAGITGCAIARQLARYEQSICVIEADNDIALGASKANGGLVHAGYDPGTGNDEGPRERPRLRALLALVGRARLPLPPDGLDGTRLLR